MPPTWPLVGRQEELELIEQIMSRPAPAGVVLSGTAGVGKTRLIHEALNAGRKRGFASVWAAATHSSAVIPFGALAHLVPEDLAAPARPGLLRAAGRALVDQAEGRRLLFCVDDAHLLDDSSASLVHHLAATGSAFPVVSVRTGEQAADSVVALWKDGLAERIEVQPLSREELDSLLETVLAGPVEGPAVYRLWAATLGNALFLRELVLGGIETESLVREGGVWRWKGGLATAPRLVEVVEARLGHLEDAERGLLEEVAAGDPLELALLHFVASDARVEQLERRGLLEVTVNGRRSSVRLAHPIYGEVLRDRTGTLRARAIRRRLADALHQTGARRREDLLRLATWRLEGGGGRPGGLFLQAAHRALWYFDFRLAQRLAEASLDAGGELPAGRAVSEALIGLGRFDEADRMLMSLERDSTTEVERVQATIGRARNLFWHMGRTSAAQTAISEAEGQTLDPDWRDELVALRAEILLFGGHVDQALETVMALLRPDASPSVVVHAAMTIGWGLAMAGRMHEVPAHVSRGMAASEEAFTFPFGFATDWLTGNLAFARFLTGDMAWGDAEMEQAYRAAVQRNAEPVRAVLAFGLGFQERIEGRPMTARARLLEAAAYFREIDLFRHLSSVLAELAYVSALVGDVTTAEARLREARAHRIDSFRMDEPFIGLAGVWVAVARGELSTARRQARGLADSLAEMGMRVFEAMALHDVARLGEPRSVQSRLAELGDQIDGSLAKTFAAHARALAGGRAEELHDVSTTFERMGATLFAAEAAAEVSRLHDGAGRRGSALAQATRARELAEQCEGARTPALLDLETPLPLTAREREIANLAARGLTNREIASRLVVSVRTVDNHLHHIYSKLGVEGRSALHDILVR